MVKIQYYGNNQKQKNENEMEPLIKHYFACEVCVKCVRCVCVCVRFVRCVGEREGGCGGVWVLCER